MMKPEFSTPSDRPAQDDQRCERCTVPLKYHPVYACGPRAYLSERVVETLSAFSPALVRATLQAALKDDGSSSTGRGGTGWRTWSRTVSFGSACLELRLDRYASRYSGRRSLSGTACFRTSGSSRSWNVEGIVIGMDRDAPGEEEQWESGQSPLRDSGSGQSSGESALSGHGGRTETATGNSSGRAVTGEHTKSPTNSPSAPSLTDSGFSTAATTRPASDPSISMQATDFRTWPTWLVRAVLGSRPRPIASGATSSPPRTPTSERTEGRGSEDAGSAVPNSGGTGTSGRSQPDDIIGTAVPTPAERCASGDHLWGRDTRSPMMDLFCVRPGCGKRWEK